MLKILKNRHRSKMCKIENSLYLSSFANINVLRSHVNSLELEYPRHFVQLIGENISNVCTSL